MNHTFDTTVLAEKAKLFTGGEKEQCVFKTYRYADINFNYNKFLTPFHS